MAKHTNRLSALRISRAMEPGLHADGNNLYLRVTPSGSKSWTLIYNWHGKRRELGLGSSTVVSLAEARQRALEGARLRQQGLDPKAEWSSTKIDVAAPSFGNVALEVIADRRAGWRNAKHAQQWQNTLRTYCAAFWDKPVAAVDIDDVRKALQPIWSAKPETASRVRGRIEAVLDAAKARKLRTGDNPAAWQGNLAHLFHRHSSAPKRHQPSMAYNRLPGFMLDLHRREELSARALELTILTAARTTEVREARWEEIDLDEAVWQVPADRMKMKRPHRVALSRAALGLLAGLDSRSGLLFPGMKPHKPLSNMTMLQLLRRMGFGQYTVHGFRSSFSTWAAEQTDYPREIVEEALAHVVGSAVERAYRRSDVLEKRFGLMEAWAGFIGAG
ncbi:tyrosine-type recombinase/integrase [Sphingomonas sp. BT552]|uniref:Tyrosine-type recombinase/integrase n=2 Tax=Sphingomonas longa TaxID=2778730 RepID=A0ABS2DAJ2_9SPHN|nr:integrase arm-type DNA-binding domain-containing protein [Microvirga sp. SRT01]MBM6577950.1 tyrosine-type recombinase/integrase [Sphingomonas sp. BT552]